MAKQHLYTQQQIASVSHLLNIEQNQILAFSAGGDDYKTLAAKLGLNIGTVKSRLHRARAALAKHVSPDDVRRARGAHSERAISRANFVKEFTAEGDFAALREAEDYLAKRGFSVGRRQRGAPCGVMFGEFEIQKWRNLSLEDRDALHGELLGPFREGPVRLTIFYNAPDHVLAASAEVVGDRTDGTAPKVEA